MRRLLPYLFSVVLVFGTLFGHEGLHNAENYNQRNIDKQQSISIWSLYDTLNTHLGEPELTEIIPSAKAGTVLIKIDDGRSGSGFIISNNLIGTARHLVIGAKKFTATFDNGVVMESDAAIIMDNYDVAFIWIEESPVDPLPLGRIEECILGEQVFIIGSPYGDDNFNAVSTGIISGLNRDWDVINRNTGKSYGWKISFTSDSSVSPGNSGGPLFTMDGKVRGVVAGRYDATLNCIIPVDLFINDIEAIEDMFYLGTLLEGYSIHVVLEWGY